MIWVRRYLVFQILLFASVTHAAPYPLYARFIPYTPPNLHLNTTRAPLAYYAPNPAATTFNFDLAPIAGSSISFSAGPIPATIALYRVPAGCSGAKTITLTVLFNIGGTFVTVGSQTQTLTVPTTGNIVPLFNFSGITAGSNYTLDPGDFVRLQIATNSSICIVNEFPTGGTDADATRVILNTILLPVLSVVKTQALVSDPVNGTSGPYFIPGALIRYELFAANDVSAAGSGDSVTFSDTIPTGTSYVNGSMTLDTGGGAVGLTDSPGDDEGEFTGTGIEVDAGTLSPGLSATVTFDVVVN